MQDQIWWSGTTQTQTFRKDKSNQRPAHKTRPASHAALSTCTCPSSEAGHTAGAHSVFVVRVVWMRLSVFAPMMVVQTQLLLRLASWRDSALPHPCKTKTPNKSTQSQPGWHKSIGHAAPPPINSLKILVHALTQATCSDVDHSVI
jgi:hypothetical protein